MTSERLTRLINDPKMHYKDLVDYCEELEAHILEYRPLDDQDPMAFGPSMLRDQETSEGIPYEAKLYWRGQAPVEVVVVDEADDE